MYIKPLTAWAGFDTGGKGGAKKQLIKIFYKARRYDDIYCTGMSSCPLKPDLLTDSKISKCLNMTLP